MIKANRKGVDCVHEAECNNVVFYAKFRDYLLFFMMKVNIF